MHDDVLHIYVHITTGALQPPANLHLSSIASNSNSLTFAWSDVRSSCNSTCFNVKYNIVSSNCGRCPSSTAYTTVTCDHLSTNYGLNCTFMVSSVLYGSSYCSSVAGATTSTVVVRLQGNNNYGYPLLIILFLYHACGPIVILFQPQFLIHPR